LYLLREGEREREEEENLVRKKDGEEEGGEIHIEKEM
jgi:hypothetical protein